MDAEALLRGVASYGLVGLPELPVHGGLDDRGWRWLAQRVHDERLGGLFGKALADGRLADGPWSVDEGRAARRETVRQTLPLETLLIETVALLTAASIPVRVHKGAALAELDYADPADRCYIDVDLLVRSEDFDRAVAVMTRAGHGRRGLPERRAGYDRRFSKDVTFLTATGRGIDVHRTLSVGPFGQSVRLADLWDGWEDFQVAGHRLRALAREQRFVSVCMHAALGGVPPRLVPLRDVAQFVLRGQLDVGRVLELATSWHVRVVLQRALRLVEGQLQVPLGQLGSWARAYVPAERELRALRPYLERLGPGPERSRETLRFIPGTVAKLRYAHAQLFPSRVYLEGRYPGYASYWREHLSSLRQQQPARGRGDSLSETVSALRTTREGGEPAALPSHVVVDDLPMRGAADRQDFRGRPPPDTAALQRVRGERVSEAGELPQPRPT